MRQRRRRATAHAASGLVRSVGVVAMGWVQRSGQLRLRHRRGGGVDRRLCVGVVGGAVDGDGSLRMADTSDQTNETDICASTSGAIRYRPG